jgi:uracil-DNA glycosylase family 4
MILFNNMDLESLSVCASECELCPRMQHRVRVLGPDNGPSNAKVMFMAEAPGRLGADRTGIPLHGDRSGDNFEHLLRSIGWQRHDLFITNAVLCNPQTEDGLNDTPSKEEVRNCSTFLAATIRLVDPLYIVTLGGAALAALANIIPHNFELSHHVRHVLRWSGRNVIPLYHTGPRAMARRSRLNMESDFQRLREVIGDPRHPKMPTWAKPLATRVPMTPKQPMLTEAVAWLVDRLQPVSLFRLHKLLYLAEVESREVLETPFLNTYFIRQKDGPFAPEVTKTIGYLRSQSLGEMRTTEGISYYSRCRAEIQLLTVEQVQVLESVARKFGNLTNRGIKMAAYRRGPMLKFMVSQKAGAATYNKPLFQDFGAEGLL